MSKRSSLLHPPPLPDDSQDSGQIITVQHLTKRYGRFVAVDDISFSVMENEIFGIVGPNGAGKTTTLECMCGIRVPDAGSISVCGFSPQKERDKIRRFVGVQLQESMLPPRLKVREAVSLFASFYPDPLDPLSVRMGIIYTMMLTLGGRTAEALSLLSRLKELYPSSPQVYHATAFCYERSGDFARAHEALDVGERLGSYEPALKIERGVLYAMQGRRGSRNRVEWHPGSRKGRRRPHKREVLDKSRPQGL